MDKKKQPKLPAPAAAEQPDKAQSETDEESYEQVPRHRATETVKERERADLLPVKVNGELVYRRDAKTGDEPLPAGAQLHSWGFFKSLVERHARLYTPTDLIHENVCIKWSLLLQAAHYTYDGVKPGCTDYVTHKPCPHPPVAAVHPMWPNVRYAVKARQLA